MPAEPAHSEAARQALRARIKTAAAEHNATLALDAMRELMRSSLKPAPDAMFCASSLRGLREDLARQTAARRLKTFVVRSVTLEPVVPFLEVEAAFNGLLLEIEMGGYGSYVDDLLNAGGALATFAPQLVFVVLDLEDIAGRLPDLCATGQPAGVGAAIDEAAERLSQMLRGLRSHSAARIVVQGFTTPPWSSLGDVGDANLDSSLPRAVEQLNRRLAALCGEIGDCVFFDVDLVAARFGRAAWHDQRMFLASRLSVSAAALGAYGRALARSAAVLFRAPRKVLCTDLDNTLWGGILGEDGPQGIATGSAFPGNCYAAYQRFLKQLSSRGILLAIASKNNEADVLEAFDLRAADLAIGLNDFVARKINWNDKAQSLRELAAELSLGLDSFVFVDDNPVECEAIRQALPEVAVVAAPVDEPWRILDMLSAQPFFDSAAITADDANRTQEYRAQAQRAQLAHQAVSQEDFLASLHIVCTFLPVSEAPLARAVQLLAKTNQFNLTTRRHSASEVERFAAAPESTAVAIRVRDRFGDAGVVGLALAELRGSDYCIDSLLLSCRVIGRGVESALLAHVAQNARRAGATRLRGEYIATRKNALCADFYIKHGFVPVADQGSGDSVWYQYDLRATAPESPAWLTLEGNEHNEFAAGASIAS